MKLRHVQLALGERISSLKDTIALTRWRVRIARHGTVMDFVLLTSHHDNYLPIVWEGKGRKAGSGKNKRVPHEK